MFYLRKITEDKVESNFSLGYNYSYTHKDVNPKGFEELCISIYGEDLPTLVNNIFGIIVARDGQFIFPLFRSSDYYIMTENGKTFSKLM